MNARPIGDPPNTRQVRALPDDDPVDITYLTPCLRAAWITDDMVRELEES